MKASKNGDCLETSDWFLLCLASQDEIVKLQPDAFIFV